MTYGDFKKYVLAYIKRSAASLTIDGQDCLSVAINAARKFSERLVDFETCRVFAKLTVDLTTGASVSAITTTAGAALSVKTIKAAYISLYDASLVPIALVARATHLHRVGRRLDDSLREATPQASNRVETPEIALVRMGDTLYLTPNLASTYQVTGTTVVVGLDVIKWLSDYSADGDTDFLLTHCYDYMTLRTVQMLNAFLKEDVRIPLNNALLEQAWRSVRIWDVRLVDAATDVSTGLD